MKRAFLAALAAATLFHFADRPVTAQSATAPPLDYFRSIFVTGDVKVFGTGLNPSGIGAIQVPVTDDTFAGKDIVAAFLYWQALARQDAPDSGGMGATFRGSPLSTAQGLAAKALNTGTPTCSASGGGTGSANGTKRVFTYFMDVLRYFPADPVTGKQAVTGSHAIQIPSNNFVEPIGASLVIVYRDSSALLRSVVIYHGAFATDQSTAGMSLTLKGFYDATPLTDGKLTLIGGNGQANKNEITRFNGSVLSNNAFQSSLGAKWDNPTFTVSTPAPDPTGTVNREFTSEATVSVGQENLGTFDCITFAAVVYSVPVNDPDHDGNLTAWETPASTLTPRPLLDPNGFALPDLSAMGADPNVPDAFVEIGHMYRQDDLATVEPNDGHTHRPRPEVLKMVGDELWGSGYLTRTSPRIKMHFDIGPWAGTEYATYPGLSDYLVPDAVARGGDAVDEYVTVCTPEPGAPEWACQYSRSGNPADVTTVAGTVGWKTGFQMMRDQLFSISPAVPNPLPAGSVAEDYCGTLVPAASAAFPGQRYACDRRFDENRRNMFRYAFFGHLLGLPQSPFACRISAGFPGVGTPVDADANGHCPAGTEPNPAFHIPRTNTGIADFPGGDMFITLAGFLDVDGKPVGTPFMQASTFTHEFGHTAELRHGGGAFEPNCKPTYLSVMNYAYQLRGLLDDDGQPHLGFSFGGGAPVNESALSATAYSSNYRLGWYAPLATSYLAGQRPPALRHCDGSEIGSGETSMVRIDARRKAEAIDWDADGNPDSQFPVPPFAEGYQPDVNFSGETAETLSDFDDWSNLHLNQVGTRRNVGAKYIDSTGAYLTGPFSIGTGKSEFGKYEFGKYEFGKYEFGKYEFGVGPSEPVGGDLNQGDMGKSEFGSGDFGKGDGGGGDLFRGDPKAGELDAETAGDLAKTPPNRFRACVSGETCNPSTAPLHDVQIEFQSPNVGGVAGYTVYRVPGPELLPGQTWTPIASVTQVVGQPHYAVVDSTPLVDGEDYTYFAVANYSDGVTSDPSRFATITAFNDPARAGDDSYSVDEDNQLVVAAPGVLANDGDDDDPCALTVESVSGLSPANAGTLSFDTATGGFTFAPAANFNTGGGPAVTFTYSVRCGSSVLEPARVSITVTPVNDPPVAANDGYATDEDTALTVPMPGVLSNDSDVESAALSAVLVTGLTPAASGTLSLSPTGNFTFTPAANYNGQASFTYQAVDASLASNTATVTITVRGVDDPPTAGNDSYSTAEDLPLTLAAPGVLANDVDLDGTTVTAVLVSQAANGTVALSANGAFTYTPGSNFSGSDSFRYTANSNGVASAAATVSIVVTSVNDLPTLSDIPNQSIAQGGSTADIPFTVGDVETAAANLSVSGSSSDPALIPTIVFGGSGASRTVRVTAASALSGTATITVTVSDTNSPTAGSTTKSFTVTVRPNAFFSAVQNTPPNKAQKAGSAIPMVWQYKAGTTVVDSEAVSHRIIVVGPVNATYTCTATPDPTTTCINPDSGSSYFRYSTTSKQWQFNLQTKDANGVAYPTGTYNVTIQSLTQGFYGSSFNITLSK
jgi:hypothetical protein